MDTSIFPDKLNKPSDTDLKTALGSTFDIWQRIKLYVYEKYPKTQKEWKYPGTKYGWSFRLKDTKRVIVYLLPRDHYFKVAFMFGDKATEEVLQSSVSEEIKKELESAKVYVEGRGIRIDVNDETVLPDIFTLVDIKLT